MADPPQWVVPGESQAPLDPSGSDFPCQNGNADPTPSRTYTAGGKATLQLKGTAVHGGGSGQMLITYDFPPTSKSVWRVLQSFSGDHPIRALAGNMNNVDPSIAPSASYMLPPLQWDVPAGLPSGKAVVAWSWFNRIGNREMYMKCSTVKIQGTQSSASNLNEDAGVLALPTLFRANSGNGCAVPEGVDFIQFKNPGPNPIQHFGPDQNGKPYVPTPIACDSSEPGSGSSGGSGSGGSGGSGSDGSGSDGSGSGNSGSDGSGSGGSGSHGSGSGSDGSGSDGSGSHGSGSGGSGSGGSGSGTGTGSGSQQPSATAGNPAPTAAGPPYDDRNNESAGGDESEIVSPKPPSGRNPSKPVGNPSKPVGNNPPKPVGNNPSKPVGKNPSKPVGNYPSRPVGKNPSSPPPPVASKPGQGGTCPEGKFYCNGDTWSQCGSGKIQNMGRIPAGLRCVGGVFSPKIAKARRAIRFSPEHRRHRRS